MENQVIKQLIESNLEGSIAHINGDGRHFDAVVISAQFESLSTLKRQQLVYKMLGDNFSNGNIHALTMKAFTPSEWESNKHNYNLPTN